MVEETSLQKPARNHGFLFNDLYFLQLQTRVNTWYEKIGRNFVFNIRFLAVTNMPNSVERSSKSKKNNKLDNFIWSDDEVELLLNVVLEYKTARTMENVDWETCQTKYVDILDLFRAQYRSKENAEQIGKEFPHESEEINKTILTKKPMLSESNSVLLLTVEEKMDMEELCHRKHRLSLHPAFARARPNYL